MASLVENFDSWKKIVLNAFFSADQKSLTVLIYNAYLFIQYLKKQYKIQFVISLL